MIKKIQDTILYESILAILAIVNVSLFIYEIFGNPTPEKIRMIHNQDIVVALIFLTDFFVGIYVNKNKKYYFKENWLNLLSSIPITNDITRSLRLLRVFRVFRLIKTASIISNSNRIKNFIKNRKN